MNGPDVTQGRNVSAFRNSDFICLFCRTGRGLLFNDPRIEWKLLLLNESTENIGLSVMSLIRQSSVLSPEDFQRIFKSGEIQRRQEEWRVNVINRFSYKSSKELYEKMLNCDIRDLDGKLTFSPTSHYELMSWKGIKGVDKITIPANSSNSEVGRALNEAFSRCTNDV